jgi:hypothetical protein
VNIFADTTVKPDLVHVEIGPPNVRVVTQGDSIVLDCIVHGRSFFIAYGFLVLFYA